MKADQECNSENAEGMQLCKNVLVAEPWALIDGIYDRGVGKRQAKKTPKFFIWTTEWMPVQFPDMIMPGEGKKKKKNKGEEGIKINQELSFRLVGLRHLLDFWVDKSWRQWAVEASA